MHKVAVVYQILAHYREPIFRRLCEQDYGVEFTLFSDSKNTINSVKAIDSEIAKLPVEKGGLRWKFVKNMKLPHHFLWQRGVVKLAFSKKYDTIIYLGDAYYLSTWVSCFLAKITGKRTLMWTHGFLSEENGLKGYVRKHFYDLADGVLVYGDRAKNIMIKKGFDPKSIYVVYNSLDYEKQKSLRSSVGVQKCEALKKRLFPKSVEQPTIFFIGRLIKNKNLKLLLQVAKLLKNSGSEINILFIGDGPERGQLERVTLEYDLKENVCFYGECHEESELAPLIMMSDLCISPGSVGLTAMHALAYGKPVITHDNLDRQKPEVEAIQPGKNGDLFQEGNFEELCAKVESWLDRKVSSCECYDIIDKKYNPENQCRIIMNAIAEVSKGGH
ncbi:2-deoxystreptamine glucosyltransferase [Anaerohalosphaera lusitana]|uniref:2-deoxystreptamine glucosyltransferase n=1 Tax=Anaerohalosphaera lusitana TaxID=1936003 RepID=A0A1U9NKS5_9BACT|nr:glycosyltransferase [Anaerohalosphaera lusitana]AQT68328.1 2-deoxystreptamine glucosyltransferase [Anaerohalosphaera lusitana]